MEQADNEGNIQAIMNNERAHHLERFYRLLARLERILGGAQKLSHCSGRMNWPQRGTYFFQESGEDRSDTGHGPRLVRVGTHALKAGSGTKLWTRLSQHKGPARSGGGNHRGSIFRLIVGTALIERDGHRYSTWGQPIAIGIGAGLAAVEIALIACPKSEVLGILNRLADEIEDGPRQQERK